MTSFHVGLENGGAEFAGPENDGTKSHSQWRHQESEVGGKVEGFWGTEVNKRGAGAEPRRGSGGEARQILRLITLVNAYCPFDSSYRSIS